MDLELSGARCLVTGADGGIGSASALRLAAEGAQLMLTALPGAALEAVAQECRALGASVASCPLDLTRPGAVDTLAAACREQYGDVEALVSCAGRTWYVSAREISDEAWYLQWELNVMVPTRLVRAFAPAMVRRGGGRVVAVSSISAKQPSAVNIAYGVTKSAQVALMRGLAEEYAADGITINSVLPGPTDTPLWRAANVEYANALGVTEERVVEMTAAALPRKRIASTDEAARVIAFLASPMASNVIGAAWTVDGGSARQLF